MRSNKDPVLVVNIFKKLWLKAVALNSLPRRFAQLEQSQKKFKSLQRDIQKCRMALKRMNGELIHVVFVCHNPSLWGKLSPVYKALRADPAFKVSLVTVPYRHVSFVGNTFQDGGMAEFLQAEKISEVISGYDQEMGKWLDLQKLSPDFVFFQTPYDQQFPYEYTSEYVTTFAQVCYVPYYGILLYEGEVEAITHPVSFFRNVGMVFVSDEVEKSNLLNRFNSEIEPDQVVVSGSPMVDCVIESQEPEETGWNYLEKGPSKRILWTPRWRTDEGNCHFFEYKDYFLDLAEKDKDIDFLFRPHPLCLQNFITTGEMSQLEQDKMIARYEHLPNASIDRSGNYQKIIQFSDILISDMSSIMAEYFITGNPIVYTHRVDTFNSFGSKLAKGFYWVKNQDELSGILTKLKRGEDPLKEKRQELIKELFCLPEGGASNLIKNSLKKRFYSVEKCLETSLNYKND